MERLLKIWIIILPMNDKIAKVTPNDIVLLVQGKKMKFLYLGNRER